MSDDPIEEWNDASQLPVEEQTDRDRRTRQGEARRRLAQPMPPTAPVTRGEFEDLLMALGIK